MYPLEHYETESQPTTKKILQSTIENPQSKLYSHSSMFMALNALKLWTFWHSNKRDNRLIAYSRTTFNLCKSNNTWNLFHELKAPIVDISLDKGRGKSSIRIHVETPQVLMEWLRQPGTLERLEEVQETNSRVGQLIIKLHDYNQFGQIEGPRRFICLTDYLMSVLIMQHLSPIVSPYKDIMVEVQVPNGAQHTLPLRQFIPRELEWGIANFIPHYTEVILHLFRNKPLTFEIRQDEIKPSDYCILYDSITANESMPDEYVFYTMTHQYYRVVSAMKILQSEFKFYCFDSMVRDQMGRQLSGRLSHCAKPKKCKEVPAPKRKKTLDDFLPDITTLPRMPLVSSAPVVSAADTIKSIVQSSIQATTLGKRRRSKLVFESSGIKRPKSSHASHATTTTPAPTTTTTTTTTTPTAMNKTTTTETVETETERIIDQCNQMIADEDSSSTDRGYSLLFNL